jgi:hypothetical protein
MRLPAITALALGLAVGTAADAANLIVNGDFNQVSSAVAALQGTGFSGAEIGSDYKYGQAVTGWNSSVGSGSAFNLYFFGDGTEKTQEADTQYGELGQHPNANYTGPSPNGGPFMILDGDPGFSGAFSQTVNGLKAGTTYDLSFYWAAGELADRTGYTSDGLQVSFGSDTQSTATYFNTAASNAPGSFSGWQLVTMAFTATASSEVVSFLSVGTPAANLPPVAFLDGVSLTVPEPAVWTMMLVGFGGLGALMRRRRALAAA